MDENSNGLLQITSNGGNTTRVEYTSWCWPPALSARLHQDHCSDTSASVMDTVNELTSIYADNALIVCAVLPHTVES
jgi:hypothetical protein